MEIYLTDLETGDRMRFPMLPENINVQTGAVFQSYSIMGMGDIKIPAGETIIRFTWEGMLPGEARKNKSYVVEWRDPKELQGLWSVYRTKKKKLRLLITETPINHDVYIENCTMDYKYGYGDCYYKIVFAHGKDLKVQTLATAQSAPIPDTTPRPEPPAAKTHTIVGGDTLWGIAQKYYNKGSDYEKIYSANKDLIEETARNHGKSNSDNGSLIYPGTIIAIP